MVQAEPPRAAAILITPGSSLGEQTKLTSLLGIETNTTKLVKITDAALPGVKVTASLARIAWIDGNVRITIASSNSQP